VSDSGKWVTVASRASIAEGEVTGVTVGDEQIALYNLAGEIFATSNICTHAFALLSDGWLDGDVIECPLHAGRYEIKTGKGLGPPIPCDIKIFPVRVAGDEVQVQIAS
jgi:nitrite reductase/ring-hydroxylating ferredoxin subunit